MAKHFSLGVGFQIILKSLPLALFTLLMFPAPADAVDGSGWMTMISEVVGDDVSCGAGKVKYELVIRNAETGDFATPQLAIFTASDETVGIVDSKNGSGVSTVGPICLDPDKDALGISVLDDAAYYPFGGSYKWKPADATGILRGKFMRATVWLRPRSDSGFDYRHGDPSLPILNASPTYTVVLNDFLSTYGATGVRGIFLYVSNLHTGFVAKSYITGASVAGGVGTKTLPAQSLPDGLYRWAYYIALSGGNPSLMGGNSGDSSSFILDTTVPDFSLGVGHVPTSPHDSNPVVITANASDALAGIKQVEVYLDGTPVKTCPYLLVASARCFIRTGPFPAGSIHSYYAVATDGAGNEATSPTYNFTVGTKGSCGPASGVQTSIAPSGAANLCTAGTPSSDPAVYNGPAGLYEWTCDGSDGLPATLDDVSCSAPESSLKICLNSCDSGSVDFNGGTVPIFPNEQKNLRACYNNSVACEPGSVNDVTDDATTTFDDTDMPGDALFLTTTKGQVQVHSAASNVSETVNILYGPLPASVTFAVPNICTKDCSNASNVCRGETFNDANNCSTNNCEGSRFCDFNWKEVAPGN